MKCLVTGAAGFIGSHLCEQLLRAGHSVVGLDAFIPYYPRERKQRNLAPALDHPAFRFHEADLRNDTLEPILEGSEVTIELSKKEGWYAKTGSKWQTMAQQMLMYRSASWLVRAYAPELAMGLHTRDEVEDSTLETVALPTKRLVKQSCDSTNVMPRSRRQNRERLR